MMPLHLPNSLDSWTYETVLAIVERYRFEPGWFDFKAVLHPRRDERGEYNASILRTACAMANTDGGYLIFGVKDPSSFPNDSPASLIIGIDSGGDVRKEVGEKLNDVEPAIGFDTVPKVLRPSNDDQRGVLVAHLFRSPLRPHQVRSTGIFYRRGAGGTAEAMRQHEVRDQMLLSEERLRRADLLRLEIRQCGQLASELSAQGTTAYLSPYRFDASAVKPLLADVYPLLPSGNPLVDYILRIPQLASTVNELFRRAGERSGPSGSEGSPFFTPEGARQASLSQLLELKRLCQESEQGLAGVLGALGRSALST